MVVGFGNSFDLVIEDDSRLSQLGKDEMIGL